MNYNNLSIEEVLKLLNSNESEGLTNIEAEKRLKKYGLNEISSNREFSILKLFIKQFYDFLTLLLIVSTVIAILAGKIPTAIAIGIIVLINVPLGFFMEYKAEKELEALKKMLKSSARVIRNKKEKLLSFKFIVPGDIIIIEPGQKIPADAILINEHNLAVNEASLTGESMPVEKEIILDKSDDSNKLFLGTIAVRGVAKAIVVKTGKNTRFGQIAYSLAKIKTPLTPLQKQVTSLGKLISIIAITLGFLVLVLAKLQGAPFLDGATLKLALSVFVTLIPAGLLIVMTFTLALGVKRMAKDKVIVKQLSSVETLGSTQVICTDKTGTLTENRMTIRKVWINDRLIEIKSGNLKNPEPDLEYLIKTGVLSNSAEVSKDKNNNWKILGDPTEASLLILGEKFNIKESEQKKLGEVFDFPFDQKIKRRMTVFETSKNEKAKLISIGAPENILEISSHCLRNGKSKKIDTQYKEKLEKVFLSLASKGYRVIGLADKNIIKSKNKYKPSISKEKEYIFIGFVALYDPPRREVKKSIQQCKDAGIKIVMITGDNPLTALAIAEEIGLFKDGQKQKNRVITGKEIAEMPESQLAEEVQNYDVFARTSPLDKLKIVKAFKAKGLIVAVTGDGVNDAPALKEADLGAAMGIRGTDVSKEAAKIIITDDNFGSIAKAVKQGRRTYDNIKKFIQFLLTANVIEFPLIFFAILLGKPIPITAIQILWINLVTDSIPALTLGTEPASKNIMKRRPRPPTEHILQGTLSFILFASFLGFIFALGLFLHLHFVLGASLVFSQTMTFSFIVVYKLLLVFSARSNVKTIFELGIFTNKPMIIAVILSFTFQLIIIYTPFLNPIFETTPLSLFNWALIFSLSIIAFLIIELKKLFVRKRELKIAGSLN